MARFAKTAAVLAIAMSVVSQPAAAAIKAHSGAGKHHVADFNTATKGFKHYAVRVIGLAF